MQSFGLPWNQSMDIIYAQKNSLPGSELFFGGLFLLPEWFLARTRGISGLLVAATFLTCFPPPSVTKNYNNSQQ